MEQLQSFVLNSGETGEEEFSHFGVWLVWKSKKERKMTLPKFLPISDIE